MNAELSAQLARLLRQRVTAALGTLRAGAPFVSMVPYALAPDGSGLVVHVSKLAAHTKDMLADARVSLLVAEAEGGAKPAQALARVSLQGLARRVPSQSPDLSLLKAAYLARFPDAAQMFGFADFSMFLIRPDSARFVAGFGEAHTLSGESMAQLLRQLR
ncbi:MAG: HugZ family pyridoxamine 5'-phosphate oxidase [Burkholderiales bacterium]